MFSLGRGLLLLAACLTAQPRGNEGFSPSPVAFTLSPSSLRHGSSTARLHAGGGIQPIRRDPPCLQPPSLPGAALGQGGSGRRGSTRSALRMALGPIGPFSPFRSTYCSSGDINRDMSQLTAAAGDLSRKFMGLMVGFQGGVMPDKQEVKKIAEEMDTTLQQWKIILTRLRLADDFQALQFFKLAEARLRQFDFSLDEMQSMMVWQIDCMKAYSVDQQPPPPPAGLEKMMAKDQGQMPQMGMPASSGVFSMPFMENAKTLESPAVTEELQKIMADHKGLVKMGETYGKWDREGKKMYIEQMEQIEERWEIFLKRFELMGEINPEFVRQTDGYLKAQQIASVEDFKELLKQTRDLMRSDAEAT